MSDLIKRLRHAETPYAKPTALEVLTDEAADALEAAADRIADLESQLTAKTELATLYAASLRQSEEEVEGLRRDARRYEILRESEGTYWRCLCISIYQNIDSDNHDLLYGASLDKALDEVIDATNQADAALAAQAATNGEPK